MGSLLIPDSSDRAGIAWQLLPHVSRTFALTIPVLQPPLRDEVAIAYLLCRVADTIEDAEGVPLRTRRDLFRMFQELVDRPDDVPARERFLETWCGRVDLHHGQLMERIGDVLEAHAGLAPPVQRAIRGCLDEMVPGMLMFLEDPRAHRPCRAVADLERYCHFVAGTVGILLTHLFARDLPAAWATPSRYEEGRRFGIGLQITNVLKDADRDRRRGVSYLPDPPAALVPLALSHLDQANAYTLSIPIARSDMRLFCAWASHLALATLACLAKGEGKVPREDLFPLLERSRAAIENDAALADCYRELREGVDG